MIFCKNDFLQGIRFFSFFLKAYINLWWIKKINQLKQVKILLK